jgi:hypothetical protein
MSSPFRLMFEVRRNLRQMCVPEITFQKQLNAFRLAYLPSVLRDVVFRTTFEGMYHSLLFVDYYKKINRQRQLGIPYDDSLGAKLNHEQSQSLHRRSGFFILSAVFANVLTHPLDMITTRLIVQQKAAYSGMIDCAKTIIKEEGYPKLLLSGFGARLGFFTIQGSLMMAFTPRVLPLFESAYSLENLIN